MLDLITLGFTMLGLGFFVAGSIGLLRFPDSSSRLHALTKADNLGLGLIALGLALQAPDVTALVKLALVWALAIFSAGAAAQLVGRIAARDLADPPKSAKR
jgi:multicomponent Na+:H+ antiporter subunit G